MQIISFDEREGTIWFDGRLIPSKEAKIHVLNHGLHYGSSVFEGERAYNGKIFKSKEHAERLIESAKILGMHIPYTVDEIVEAKNQVLVAQDLMEAYIRPVAWSGSERMTIAAPDNIIHLAIAAWEWPNYYKNRQQGVRLTLANWRRPDPLTAPVRSKASGLYMIASISKNEATKNGYDDALMLDYRGYIAEATGANFFMVVKGELHTPIPDCFLDGITRRTIIDLAKNKNIKVVERHINLEELAYADEAFLTGTAAEITPIKQVDEYQFILGPITELLTNEYHRLTHV